MRGKERIHMATTVMLPSYFIPTIAGWNVFKQNGCKSLHIGPSDDTIWINANAFDLKKAGSPSNEGGGGMNERAKNQTVLIHEHYPHNLPVYWTISSGLSAYTGQTRAITGKLQNYYCKIIVTSVTSRKQKTLEYKADKDIIWMLSDKTNEQRNIFKLQWICGTNDISWAL